METGSSQHDLALAALYRIPFPRKGMETISGCQPELPPSNYRIPFPRKGMETEGCGAGFHLLLPLYRIPFPRKGMETVPSANALKITCFSATGYLFPVRGWKQKNQIVFPPRFANVPTGYLFPVRGWKRLTPPGRGGRKIPTGYLFPVRGWKPS